MTDLIKYPRTRHIEGSSLQAGDEDLEVIRISDLARSFAVIEEKLDGANCGVSFDESGRLRLQSRGHFLTGGPRERQFDLFKRWASAHAPELHEVLGSRYVMYGEWMYAKHTLYYDRLPHYFMEFDVLDLQESVFLSTGRRRELLQGLPVVSVPVLFEGGFEQAGPLQALIRTSLYRSPAWKDKVIEVCEGLGIDSEQTLSETDRSDLAEGIYIKIESEGRVTERLKFVRAGFVQSVPGSASRWMDRPIVPNQLASGVDIFAR